MTLADMGETRSNHTVYNINYHFVWCRQSEIDCLQISDLQCPKYRHSVLDEIEQSLEVAFREVCDEYNYEILSLHISPDHVHLFVSAHPKWFERLRLSSSRESSILERHSPSEIARKIQEHHSQRDVAATRTTLGNLLLGWRILGRIVLHWNGW